MRIYLVLAIAALTLSSCGLKGPLYLPQQKPAADPAPAKAAPNPQTDDKKTPGSK